MSTRINDSQAETIVGAAAVSTGGGALSFALFPFLLPNLILLAVLAIPLLPLAVVGALAYGAFALLRGVARLGRGRRSRSKAARHDEGSRSPKVAPRVVRAP